MQALAMSISPGLMQHSLQWKYCKVLSSTVIPSTWSPCTTQILKWCVLPKMDHAAEQAFALLGPGTRIGQTVAESPSPLWNIQVMLMLALLGLTPPRCLTLQAMTLGSAHDFHRSSR
jgi:hypothetical protein